MKKRFISVLLSIFLLLAAMPWNALAVESVTVQDLTITVSNGTLTISGNRGMNDALAFRDKLATYKDSNILHVVIEEGVTDIAYEAFQDFVRLQSVELPNGLKEIHGGAFWGCRNLSTIVFGDGLNDIGGSAFALCDGLTTIYLPEGLTQIDGDSFSECANLTYLYIPASVTDIAGAQAFGSNPKLRTIEVSKNNMNYRSVDGVLFNKSMTHLFSYPMGKTDSKYTIPSGVTELDWYAFADNQYITSVVIPEGVTELCYTFKSCSNLKSVVLPSNMERISNQAFAECTNLSTITIPSGVWVIGHDAFENCVNLSEPIVLPDSVEVIGINAFDGCKKLSGITIPPSVVEIGSASFEDCPNLTIYCEENSTAHEYAASNGIPYVLQTTQNYTISYDANGGTGAPADQIKQRGIPLIISSVVPTRPGWIFEGWWTARNGSFQPGDQYTLEKSITLSAKWTPLDYTVSFDANGGTVNFASKTVTNGEYYGYLPTPTRTDYIFSGWSTEADGGSWISGSDRVDLTADQTLYAQWIYSPASYTVTFNANGGTVSTASKLVTNGHDYGYLPTPTRSDYRFDGWFTASSGGTKIDNTTIVNLTGSQTLYAHWTYAPASYMVTFNPNGGTVSTASKAVTNGSAYGTLPTPTRNSYIFDGWFTASSGGTQIVSTTIVNLSENQTLFAHWTYAPVTYTVTFNANGGSVSTTSMKVINGSSYGDLPTPARSNYRFDGWFTASSGGTQITSGTTVNLTANQTLYAHWTYAPASYTVTFNANGGTVGTGSKAVTNGSAYGALPIPTQSGYKFEGWFTASSGGSQVTSDTIVNLSANQTLYAHWVALYTVTYNANGGTGTPSSQAKENNVALTLSTLMPTKAYIIRYNANGGSVSPANKSVNCPFKNWNTAVNGSGTTYNPGGNYKDNKSVTLYAQWKNPSAGTLAIPNRSGYTFAGWFTAASGGTRITESSTITGEITVYAHWSTEGYKMGVDSYSFSNYGDSDSPGGHCFGMSITSAGYYNGVLDISRIGGNASTKLYSFDRTSIVKAPICYYQAIQGERSAKAIVAGGSSYLYGYSNIGMDWQEVVNYVRNHDYDNTGLLQIGFRKNNEGGHAINFLRYENVNGQDRLYAYDNNFPTQETCFYCDSSGRVWQKPVQTFSGSIDCIALRDIRTYFSLAGDFDMTHALYTKKDAVTVQGYSYSIMDTGTDDEVYVMYEIPSDQDRVKIIPNQDNADFIYMDTEYSFGSISDDTYGELRFATMDEGAVTVKPIFKILDSDSAFGEADFKLPAALTVIDESAFEGIKATSIYIPDTCISICAYAFRNAAVRKIRIPARCTIADTAFNGCEAVRIYGTVGSPAETFCNTHSNCTFIAE